MAYQASAPNANAIAQAFESERLAGHRPLHLFVEDGDITLASWCQPTPQIREARFGPGPFRRPSANGHPQLWLLENDLPQASFGQPQIQPLAHGSGLHRLPLGPVRADVAEALRYEMQVLGDEIHAVQLRAGFKHRHVRALMQGEHPGDAVRVAERITGTSPVAHATALSLAVEASAGVVCSPAVQRLRVVLAELERLMSHLGDLATLASATASVAAGAELLRLKELVLRFNARWTGHRYLRGVVAPGGLARPLGPSGAGLRDLADALDREFGAVRRALERTNSFLDRLHGTGRIPPSAGAPHDLVGFVGRSAGCAEDIRWARPYAAYGELLAGRRPPVVDQPDAFGRYVVRAEEIISSIWLLRRIGELPSLPAESAPPAAAGVGHALVEAPRGRLFYRVRMAADRLRQVDLRTPSSINWTAVPQAVANNNILQDFPIIDASFNLAVSALDL